MSIPHLFRCPISLDIFNDPVTLCTGQTYDRAGIEKWLAAGNLTCPVTMQRLHDTTLVPNHTLKHLIDQWLLPDTATANPIRPKSLTTTTAATTDADAATSTAHYSLATLKKDLQSASSTPASALEALNKLRSLSVESDIGRARLIQLGFLQLLLHLLFRPQPAFDAELVEAALDCVLSLSSAIDADSLNMLEEKSIFDSLLQMLEQSNPKIKSNLCYLLEAMATASEPQELRPMLGHSQRVWRVLLPMLQNSSASEAAAQAIAGICTVEANQTCAISNGAVDGLVLYLSNSRRKNASRALEALELLVGLDAGKSALAKIPNAIQVLVNMVFRMLSRQEGSEHAVGTLLEACRDSACMRLEAVNAGVLTQLLLLLQSECSSRAKSKARALLKLLRSIWAEEEQQPKV